jgi:hypothetical protein
LRNTGRRVVGEDLTLISLARLYKRIILLTGLAAWVICRFNKLRPSSPRYQIRQSAKSTPVGGAITLKAGSLPFPASPVSGGSSNRTAEGFCIVANEMGREQDFVNLSMISSTMLISWTYSKAGASSY